jgi:hypothetical protein
VNVVLKGIKPDQEAYFVVDWRSDLLKSNPNTNLCIDCTSFGMVCSFLKQNNKHIEQVRLLRATAHGVHLASIRLELALLLRSAAHGVLLESIRLDQVAPDF